MKPLRYKSVSIRFYEELNDFLPPVRRKKTFDFKYSGKPTVRDLIQNIGIPHTETPVIYSEKNLFKVLKILANPPE